VRDEQDGPPRVAEVFHPPQTPRLELGVADREHLVHQQDLRLEVRGDREREPDVHAARVAFYRRVDEPLDAGELDDVVEAALDLSTLHAENRPVEVDVLASGQLLVEAGTHFEQAPHAAANLRPPGCR
jgi:hypothetical protein